MISLILKLTIILLLLVVIFGIYLTWKAEHSPEQTLFLSGTLPSPSPDGLYLGVVSVHKVSWLGKKFNSVGSTGINVFDDGKGGQVDKYSFVTSVGNGIRDKNLNVLKIDYNISSNPFWLRFVLDEIVQTATSTYLGKLQLLIIPKFPLTITYFKLQK